MKKYNVIVKWCEEYEFEIEAENEDEAYDEALEQAEENTANDCYLLDVQIDECED